MKQKTTTSHAKKATTTSNAKTATNNQNTTQEVATMKNANVHATDYLSKDKIREELKVLGIELSNSKFKNTKREVLLEMLEAKKAETTTANATKPAMPIAPVSTDIPVGDLEITKDNAPQEIPVEQEQPKKSTVQILYDVVANCCYVQYYSKKQVAKNYVSDYMLKSCINHVLHGKYSKEKNGQDNTFTDIQQKQTEFIKDKLIQAGFVTEHKGTGYIIKARLMAWYYEGALKLHVVYRFRYEDKSKGYVDYKVDFAKNELLNLRDNKVTKLDDAGWAKVDATLNFNRTMK